VHPAEDILPPVLGIPGKIREILQFPYRAAEAIQVRTGPGIYRRNSLPAAFTGGSPKADFGKVLPAITLRPPAGIGFGPPVRLKGGKRTGGLGIYGGPQQNNGTYQGYGFSFHFIVVVIIP
jgi:hypothetical protein